MANSNSNRWALVLAGGDGSRLRSFTKRIVGHEIPKQFCPIFTSKSLLDETLERVSKFIGPSQTLVSVNRAHRCFYRSAFHAASQWLVEEPLNCGTAPAILNAIMHLYELGPDAIVGVFPSDHYVGNEDRLFEYVNLAFAVAADSDDAIILLGAEASGPEQAFGWIEPETSLGSPGQCLFSVRRFIEKPDARLADELWRGGALWNTLIVVARVSALLHAFMLAMPGLYASFSGIGPVLGTALEADALTRLYAELPPSEFSDDVLQRCAANLLVLRMRSVEWCDLGEASRVMQVIKQTGVSPRWARA